ncbi:MAG: DNA-directed RNA polymerase subunit A' [Conexivisphaerales archaeon]
MSESVVLNRVDSIKFAALSPSEIRKYAAVEITVPETYDEDGMPVQGGLMDNRLGVLEPGQKCGTCGNPASSCPGHFGYIELAEPVIHIAFADDVHRLMTSTCRKCGRLLLPDEEIEEYRKQISDSGNNPITSQRVVKEIVAKAKKTKICPHCGARKLDIEFTKPHTFHEITEEGGPVRLMPTQIREWMERIPDSDIEVVGYNPKTARPEWFVLQVLPVPPVSVRPSIILETGIRSEDDLTHKLVDILRVNQRVAESKEYGTPPLIVQDLADLLQYHVTTYFDNEVSGIPQAHHRSGRPLRTLAQRLKGKEGRFRGNLSGKRVDFSSRTVISPDPNLDISEVGVPQEVAKKLTVPERVAPWNIEFLRGLVRNGPDTYPGANYIIRPDGIKIRLEYVQDREALAQSLNDDYIIERHIMDGDVVLFNRQPSLHRMSIMAHFVHVLPGRTFRLHPAVCPPYNADFDGDEMNLHVPQSEEAQAEAMHLMKVQGQIISPRYGAPIMGGIRDYITGAFMLTEDSTRLSKQEFMNLAYLGGYHEELGLSSTLSGKDLVSLFMPKGFDFVGTSKWAGGNRKDVLISNGKMISGVIDKATIGAEEADSILHRVAKDYGPDAAKAMLDSLLKIFKEYLTRRGFSYGYDELEIPDTVKKQLGEVVKEAHDNVIKWINMYKEGKLPVVKGVKLEDMLENYIMNELSKSRDRAAKIVEKVIKESNAGIIMARSGARGSSLNLGQMMAMLGQQSIRGKRITRGYSQRALSHYGMGDISPEATGFVSNSFRDGLTPLQFFFHAMAGREGLVDTAVRTQQSGYLQRRLINAMEHLKVEYDMTVRDPEGGIIQFTYGEDGIDPSKSDHGLAVNVQRLIEIVKTSDSGTPAPESYIKKNVDKIKDSLSPKIAEDLINTLKKSRLSMKAVTDVCDKTVEKYYGSLVDPGEAVGVVAAQSLGEPGTQMTLRTFHFAGVRERDVTLGLPRLIELLDARKEPSTPSMEIYLDEEYRKSADKAQEIARSVIFTRLEAVIDDSYVEPAKGEIVFTLSPSKLSDKGISAEDVGQAISGGKRKVEIKRNKVTVKASNYDLSALQTLRNKLLNMKVGGMPGIVNASVMKRGDEWMIETSGSNLSKVLLVPHVDTSRTISNNIYEVANVLGIEAARNVLIKEISGVLTEQGLEVDYRHIALIADIMTSRGIILPVGRHGIVGYKTSILAKAAFEITVPTLAGAASKGLSDDLLGVTENVIVGSTIPIGTGMVKIFM